MKLLKASKILHVVVLLCCFLPAIFSRCSFSEPSKEELEQREKEIQDSLDKVTAVDTIQIKSVDSVTVENKTDTTVVDSILISGDANAVKTSTVVESEVDINTVDKLTLEEAFARLLFPDGNNFSMAGYAFFAFMTYSPILFVFMLIWSVLLRFTNSNHKLIFIQTLIGQIALTIFIPTNLKDLMWGFWILYAFSLLNAILNWWIYFSIKKQEKLIVNN